LRSLTARGYAALAHGAIPGPLAQRTCRQITLAVEAGRIQPLARHGLPRARGAQAADRLGQPVDAKGRGGLEILLCNRRQRSAQRFSDRSQVRGGAQGHQSGQAAGERLRDSGRKLLGVDLLVIVAGDAR